MFIIFLKKKNLVYKVTKLLYLEIENSCLKGKVIAQQLDCFTKFKYK